jgi:iron complex outermembrane receptor protein
LNQLKAGVDYRVTSAWTVGAVLTYFSDQYLKGDESNQNKPLAGYTVVNLHTTYRLTDDVELFANVSNLLDAKCATFAQYGDPTGIGASGIPIGVGTNGPGVDSRFLAPGPPIAAYGGLRVRF